MGCNNANVKEDPPPPINNQNVNQKNPNSEEESRLDSNDDDNNNDIEKTKDNKLLLNLYSGKTQKIKVYSVPKIQILNHRGPEDKKPPDIKKLREKKLKKSTQKENNNPNIKY